jgi:hypothetical protein
MGASSGGSGSKMELIDNRYVNFTTQERAYKASFFELLNMFKVYGQDPVGSTKSVLWTDLGFCGALAVGTALVIPA